MDGAAGQVSPFSTIIQLAPDGLLAIVVRTVIVYVALFLGLRLAGKRELGQMTPFDLVVILVISNAVQNAMVGPDTSLTGGLVAAFTLLVVNRLVVMARLHWHWFGHELTGDATLLINHGQFVDDHLRLEGLDQEDVIMAMREHGVADVKDVEMAVLEVDGTISIVPTGSETHRTRRRVRGRKPAG